MNIFYSASVGSKNQELNDAVLSHIPDILRSIGHQVTVNFYDPDEQEKNQVFDTVAKNILEADIFIGEMSRASQTLGFELAFALLNSKPCLYLYHSSRAAKPGDVLSENTSRLLKIKTYTYDEIEKVLSTFLRYAESQLNTSRTSFMSTKQIDSLLASESNRLGISKGEIIRNILSASQKTK